MEDVETVGKRRKKEMEPIIMIEKSVCL